MDATGKRRVVWVNERNTVNFQTRLTIAFVAFLAMGIYVNLFSGPARMPAVAKAAATKTSESDSATTNEVVALLGKPFQIVDSTNFIESADEMAEEGNPVSTADMRAKGMVWLYPDGGINRAGGRRYRAIFF